MNKLFVQNIFINELKKYCSKHYLQRCYVNFTIIDGRFSQLKRLAQTHLKQNRKNKYKRTGPYQLINQH